MKKCKNCGSRNPDDATVCVECKAEFPGSASSDSNDMTTSAMAIPEQTSAQSISMEFDYAQQPKKKAPPEATGKAVVALVIGIVGLFIGLFAFAIPFVPAIYGVILCIVGIVLGVKARNKIPLGASGRGIATAGMTLSILGLIFSLVQTLIFVCVCLGVVAIFTSTPSAYVDYTILLSVF